MLAEKITSIESQWEAEIAEKERLNDLIDQHNEEFKKLEEEKNEVCFVDILEDCLLKNFLKISLIKKYAYYPNCNKGNICIRNIHKKHNVKLIFKR